MELMVLKYKVMVLIIQILHFKEILEQILVNLNLYPKLQVVQKQNVIKYDATDVTISKDVVMDNDLQMSDGKITIDQQTLSNATSTITFNPSLGSNAKVTLNGDKTLAMSGWVTGDTGVLLVEQGSGTTYTVTLPGGSVIIGGVHILQQQQVVVLMY